MLCPLHFFLSFSLASYSYTFVAFGATAAAAMLLRHKLLPQAANCKLIWLVSGRICGRWEIAVDFPQLLSEKENEMETASRTEMERERETERETATATATATETVVN